MRRPLTWFAVIVAITLVLGRLPSPWAAWPSDGCREADCYCETLRDRFVAQPLAAYSSLAFVLIGLLAWAAPRWRRSPGGSLLTSHARYAFAYGAALIALGLGSFFYHASLTLAGEWFDIVGMYLVIAFYSLYNLARLGQPNAFWPGYALVFLAGGAQMIAAREWQQIGFAVLVGCGAASEALVWLRPRPRLDLRLLGGALICLGAGGALWIAGYRLPCDPAGWLQPHALWHLLAAAATGLMWLYYRSERPADGRGKSRAEAALGRESHEGHGSFIRL